MLQAERSLDLHSTDPALGQLRRGCPRRLSGLFESEKAQERGSEAPAHGDVDNEVDGSVGTVYELVHVIDEDANRPEVRLLRVYWEGHEARDEDRQTDRGAGDGVEQAEAQQHPGGP